MILDFKQKFDRLEHGFAHMHLLHNMFYKHKGKYEKKKFSKKEFSDLKKESLSVGNKKAKEILLKYPKLDFEFRDIF